MSVATKDKRAQRANLWDQMEKILSDAEARKDNKGLSAEERATYEALEKDLDDLGKQIDLEERHDQRAKELNRPQYEKSVGDEPEQRADAPTASEDYSKAFRKWMVGGQADLTSEERSALHRGYVQADGRELRAQGVATGAAGGYAVPAQFRARLQETMKFFGGVRSVAEVIETETGADLPWPTNDDTANKGAILAENTQVTEQDVTLGQKTVGAYMYTSKLVRVSLQLLNDSFFDLDGWLARKLAERIARIQNEHFTTGTGTAQPEGVQTNSTIAVTGTTGQTTSVIYDDLVNLIYSIDPAYRSSGRARFMMNDASIGKVRLLKDSQNRPLWEPSLQVGTPDSLLGYGITPNNDMPVMAANAKSILFGDFFAGYVIRDVADFALLRLSERYADYLQVGFLGFQRGSGAPQDAAAYKAYRNSAT